MNRKNSGTNLAPSEAKPLSSLHIHVGTVLLSETFVVILSF